MARSPSLWLDDLLQAIEDADLILGRKGLVVYSKDIATKRAIERCLQIISEAANRLPKSLTSQQPDIPWEEIKGMGNILRHEYMNVSDAIVWKAARDYLKPLKKAVLQLYKFIP